MSISSERRRTIHVPQLVGRLSYPQQGEDASKSAQRLAMQVDLMMSELQRFLHYLQDASDVAVSETAYDPNTPEIVDGTAGDIGDPTTGWATGRHRHQVRTGAPVGLGNANAFGAGPALPYNDHVHKRDVRVKKTGVDVATRNALDVRDTPTVAFTVADDLVNDEVDVSATVPPWVVVAATTYYRHFLLMGA